MYLLLAGYTLFGGVILAYFLITQEERSSHNADGDDPRHRIGLEKTGHCAHFGEDGIDPYNAESAGAEERNDHRQERISDAAQRS